MKSSKKILFMCALASIAMYSCEKYAEVKPDNRRTRIAYTIEKLISTFGTELGDTAKFPPRSNSGTMGLFSVDTIPPGDEDIIITGRITSDDLNGNMYKYITIQDSTSDWSLKISIDASGISSWYPLGTVVTIKCNGLALGKYADMFQLGVKYYNNNKDATKKGYEPGRIPLPLFTVRAETNGMPELDKLKIDTITIAQLNQAVAATDRRSIHARLICIKNVWFNQKSQGNGITEVEKIFAPSTNGIGYPQSRDIEDGSGGYVSVATSEYSKFAGEKLPSAEYKGNIIAIVGWYKDKNNPYPGNVQLTIRSLDDLQLYSQDDGSPWKPVSTY
ncbi:MAG: DUF5689 domain-containing protein [Prevotellaceae bacterium]|jgi:hypothetical protein|nr:DUF5689 domain-containing protein [Prevotellaceae bacterium]